MSVWNKHPGVRSEHQLTLGERAADKMRNGMGSWPFVFAFVWGMILWATINGILHVGGHKGFDPYPFILLNLFLSMIAGLQGAILLIAAKRQDQIASELAHHDYATNQENLQLTKAIGSLSLNNKELLEQNTKLTETVHNLTKEIHSKLNS